ncbi:sialidase [Helicobacter cetorum]|uniref:sialidase n=1 Tax=Helicobacter cetorum TaxID=138563 RepID=UPI000CF0D9D2|nr:sialidase [Helicobacter cetorum]
MQQEDSIKDTQENLEVPNVIFNISKNNTDLEETHNLLDENLQALKNIGVQEICKKTRISSTNLNYLLEKRYESLSRVHAKGFLQILEREYKMDLSAWMTEYDRVCVFKSDIKTPSINQAPNVKNSSDSMHKIELDYKINQATSFTPKNSSKLKWFIAVVVVVAIVCVVTMHNYYEDYQANHKALHNEVDKKPTETPMSNLAAQQETQAPKEEKKEEEEIVKKEPEIIYITPKRDIWVEVIDLDDRANSFQKTLKETYLLETNNHRLLLRFGHGNFSLKLSEESRAYNDNKTKRFFYAPKKGLELIDDSQYKKLQQ